MLQRDEPDDFVIATGETHSVKEFAELAFRLAGLDLQEFLVVDESFYRPADVHLLMGDCSKGKKILDWEPDVKFEKLVRLMVDADLKT
mgnify:FL=1